MANYDFVIGNIITAKGSVPYAYTDERGLYQITKIRDDRTDDIYIEAIAHIKDTSYGFWVNHKYFIPVTDVEKWISEHDVPQTAADAFANCKVDVVPYDGEETAENKVEYIYYMDPEKFGSYTYPESVREKLMKTSLNLLHKYHYEATRKGVGTIFDEMLLNKGWLINLLRRHPNWNEEKQMIIFSETYTKPRDQREVDDWCEWIKGNIGSTAAALKEEKFGPHSYADVKRYTDHLGDIWSTMRRARLCGVTAAYNGMGLDEVAREMARYNELLERYQRECYTTYGCAYTKTSRRNYIAVQKFADLISEFQSPIVDDYFVGRVKAIFDQTEFEIRAVVGQKVTKVINQFARKVGFDKIVEMKRKRNGEMKDYGWNYRFAQIGDAVNPHTYVRHTCISVNAVDFWTMSFGRHWASCHTIDKEDERDNGGHSYRGCYSSGTESYMLDGSSVVFYLVDEKYDGTDFELQDKMKRCMFHIGQDKIVQGRVYPDGRDGGDEGLSAQFRGIMQKVIADCLGVPNSWKLLKGSSNCDKYTDSYGTHYRDYIEYEDGTVSLLKQAGGFNEDPVMIGHDPICPVCGCEHDTEEWITCDDCRDVHTCERCGCVIEDGNGIYDEDTGNWYCSASCAEWEDCYYCENVDEWHSRNVYYDDYCNEHFYDPCGEYVVAYDGSTFRNAEIAEEAGYREVDGDWYHVDGDHIVYCDHCNNWVLASNYNYELDCCNDCAERESEVA